MDERATTPARRRITPYAVLVPLPFCLLPYVQFLNTNRLHLVDTGRILTYAVVTWLVVLVAIGITLRLVRGADAERTALVATSVVATFFAYGQVVPQAARPGSWTVDLLIWSVLATAVALGVHAASRHDAFRTAVLIGGCVLVGVTGGDFVVNRASGGPPPPTALDPTEAPELIDRPSVYFLLLDEYARDDHLLDATGYDNAPHREALRERGFVVSERARSSYNFTELSVSSTLSMALTATSSEDVAHGVRHLQELITARPPVVERFRAAGYDYVFSSAGTVGWSRCSLAYADRCIDPDESGLTLGEAELSLLDTTPLDELDLLEPAYTDPVYVVEQLEAMGARDAPMFLFAHVLMPHTPYRFHADCSTRAPSMEPDAGRYVEQVRCTNAKVLEAVDRIIERDPDAVIIVQSDHGGPLTRPSWAERLAAWSDDDLVERLSVQSAIRLPERCHDTVPDDLALVNTFRIVLGCLEHREPELLEHRAWYWTSAHQFDLEPIPPERLTGLD